MKASLVFLAIAAVAIAPADVVSRFDTDREGWIAADVNPATLEIASSTPDIWRTDHVEAQEFGSGLFVFAAPDAYLGDKSKYYGGAVTFRLSDAVADGIPYPNLLLRGDGFAMAYATPPPSNTGTAYTIPLTETGWESLTRQPVTKAQFQSALASLDEFGVNADWKTAGQDFCTLDDVVLAAPVPEPVPWLALGVSLVAFVGRRRVILSP